MYTCPCCNTDWEDDEITSEMVEKEGCPDCLWECERCGDLIDGSGTFEHCL